MYYFDHHYVCLCIYCGIRGNDVFGTNPKLSLQQYHSMFRTLIRAVSCSLRILPTYIFLQKPESGVSSYSLDLEPHEDDLKDDIAFNSCKFCYV